MNNLFPLLNNLPLVTDARYTESRKQRKILALKVTPEDARELTNIGEVVRIFSVARFSRSPKMKTQCPRKIIFFSHLPTTSRYIKLLHNLEILIYVQFQSKLMNII